ncbi:hypothetical protein NN561_016670 [Cricetulus griseus]
MRSVRPGAPPRRLPCGTRRLRRPAPRALEADTASECPNGPQDRLEPRSSGRGSHAHSECTGPVRLPTPDLGREPGAPDTALDPSRPRSGCFVTASLNPHRRSSRRCGSPGAAWAKLSRS